MDSGRAHDSIPAAASTIRNLPASSARPAAFPSSILSWMWALFRKSSLDGDMVARFLLMPSIENCKRRQREPNGRC